MKSVCLACVAAAVVVCSAQAKTLYVDPVNGDDNASGEVSADGTVTNALKTFSKANGKLAAAGDEIVLFAGTYTTGVSLTHDSTTVRGITGNPKDVILDGEGVRCPLTSYATNVTFASFTVRRGYNANDGGGASFKASNGGTNRRKDLTISNCVFEACSTETHGGAVLTYGGTDFIDCTFATNSAAAYGGAVEFIDNHVSLPQTRFIRCTFVGNTAGGGGGAIYNSSTYANSRRPEYRDCTFKDNTSSSVGGAIYNILGSVDGCTFSGNRSLNKAGGAIADYCNEGSYTNWIANTTFKDNYAKTYGGVYSWNQGNRVIFTNCTMRGNQADLSGAILAAETYNLKSCSMYDCVVVSNVSAVADAVGGIVRQREGEYTPGEYVRCTFADNRTRGNNMALFVGTNCLVHSCKFIRNQILPNPDGTKRNNGHALYISGGSGTVRDCLFYANTNWQANGSAVTVASGKQAHFEMTHCTVVSNAAVGTSYIAGYIWSGVKLVANNIFFGNYNATNATTRAGDGRDVYLWLDNDRNCTNNYVTVGGSRITEGFNGNMVGTDPRFEDPAHGDFTPQRRSRCRDAGILLDWTVGAKDLGGLHDRWIGAAPDLGCYESWKIPGILLFVK